MDENTRKSMDEVIAKAKEGMIKDFDAKYLTMEEFQKAIDGLKQPMVVPADEKSFEAEKKFWSDLAQGKTAGDLDTAANGATIVPTFIANKIYEKLYQRNYVRELATVFPDDKGTVPFEGTALSASRLAELTAPNSGTPGTGTYTAVSYDTYDLAADTLISNKLIDNATPMVLDYIYSHLAKQFAKTELSEFITGDNSTQMQGLRGVTTLNSVTCASATTLATLEYDDLVDTYYAIEEQYQDNAVWIMNKSALAAVKKMKDVYGMPVFNASDKTIFGAKVYQNSSVATSGTTYPVIYFGDWKGYFVFDKMGMQIFTSREGRDLTSKRATYILGLMRTDGKVVDPNGMAALKLHA